MSLAPQPPMPPSRPIASDSQAHVDAIIAAALAAADPRVLMPGAAEKIPEAFREGRIAVLAVGKAAMTMARALPAGMKARIDRGLVVVSSGVPIETGIACAQVLESDHPIPTRRSVIAGAAAMDLAEQCARERVPLLVLLSGGASSLMCLPEPGLEVDDIAEITSVLLRAGAGIDDLNTVRIHCDRLKGGGLAAAAAPSPVHTIILSDVMGDHPELVGSGPTIATGTDPGDALAILKRRRALSARSAITSHLRFLSAPGREAARGREPRTGASFVTIGSNAIALAAAAHACRQLGFEVDDSQPPLSGEARDAAFATIAAARTLRARAGDQPFALLRGGETTVTVRNSKGRGGRNLEGALAAAIMIDGDPSLHVATFATDGIDGTSDAAGAVASGTTAATARRAGLDPEDHLARNDSHRFFDKAGGLIRLGPTGTNVNDLWLVLGY